MHFSALNVFCFLYFFVLFACKIKITYTPTTSNGATWRMRDVVALTAIFRCTPAAISAPNKSKQSEWQIQQPPTPSFSRKDRAYL